MKQSAKTKIAILLDESGSMQGNEHDVIGGTNGFIGEQKKETEIIAFKFGTHLGAMPKIILGPEQAGNLKSMEASDYQPSGMTNLLDAVGYTIGKLDNRVGKNDVGVCFIFTDGQENASKEFKRQNIEKMIAERKKMGWLFLFAGADLSDFSDAENMGVARSSRVRMSKAEMMRDMSRTSHRIALYEAEARRRRDQDMEFDADELFDQSAPIDAQTDEGEQDPPL
jgi:hypothetical protein